MPDSHMLDDNWSDRERIEYMWEAIEAVDVEWDRLASARNPLESAQAITELSNRLHDLRTWHPTWDPDSGTLGWQREQED